MNWVIVPLPSAMLTEVDVSCVRTRLGTPVQPEPNSLALEAKRELYTSTGAAAKAPAEADPSRTTRLPLDRLTMPGFPATPGSAGLSIAFQRFIMLTTSPSAFSEKLA